MWTFDKLTGHRKLPGDVQEVKVLQTWEPMQTTKEDEHITLDSYKIDNKPLNTPNWKWERCIIKNPNKFISMANMFQAQNNQQSIKYKYGLKVPQISKEDIQFD